MAFSLLPPVKDVQLPEPSYFPNNFYKAVFRLWETCSSERIAKALGTSEDTVKKAAAQMSLPSQQCIDKWLERGYITTIKNAWHTLPYDQLLTLLDWDEEKLASVLKEDDFLGYKLNNFKPCCENVQAQLLDDKELLPIKKTMEKYFSDFPTVLCHLIFVKLLKLMTTTAILPIT